MKKKILSRLNGVYYTLFVVMILVATLLWYLFMHGQLVSFAPQSTVGQAVQYIVIAYVIASIPTALYLFKRLCRKISAYEDGQKYALYLKWGIVRMIVIGIGMILGVAAFYLLQGYQSMIWCAAIAAIGLFFCKPNERKIELDLLPDDMQQ